MCQPSAIFYYIMLLDIFYFILLLDILLYTVIRIVLWSALVRSLVFVPGYVLLRLAVCLEQIFGSWIS